MMENKELLKRFGVKETQKGIFREGFIQGLKTAENFYKKVEKENNRLKKELIESNKIIKDMEENAEEFAKDCEERLKKKFAELN